MILSMTGYGEVQQSEDGVAYMLELRSVNNRYFKASIRLPDLLGVFESEVEKLLRTRLSRGSVIYNLRLRDTRPDAAQEINLAAVESYISQLGGLKTSLPVQIDLAALLALPGVCQPPGLDEAKREQQWKTLESMSLKAMDQLIEMRRAEGRSLRDDLVDQCVQIRRHVAAIAERAPLVLMEYHRRLLTRTNELLNESKLQLQLDDLKREVALYAERCDINEEISRLSSHLEQFEKLCDSRELAGRKLDFLAQELLREANTLGSKANDAVIALQIVEIKGAIDRLKEQVQNVE